MNWLMQLYTYIRLLGCWQLSWCMCSDYMGCMNQPICFFFIILPYLVLITLSWSLSLLSMDLLTDILLSLIFYSLFSSHFLWLLSSSLCDIGCSHVLLFLCGPMYLLLLLLVSCFPSCVKMLSSGSVLVCLCIWSCRFCSAEICIGFICCLFCVTSLPFLWCNYGMICHDDSDHLSLQSCHGSMVPNFLLEPLQ